MLENDRIFTHFLGMTGLDKETAKAFRPLCDAAGRYLAGRLREGVPLGGNMDRLCLAAAALAYGDWLELGGSALRAQEVRVGEITLRESSAGAAPRGVGLREHFLAGVADLLAPRVVLASTGQAAGEEDAL